MDKDDLSDWVGLIEAVEALCRVWSPREAWKEGVRTCFDGAEVNLPPFLENPRQGSFAVDYLTDLVEEAVCKEFEAISERGGEPGAIDTVNQRGKIQEESMYYEHKKHDPNLPLVGVNTSLPKERAGDIVTQIELFRSTGGETGQQIRNMKYPQFARNALRHAAVVEVRVVGWGSYKRLRVSERISLPR